MTVVLDASAVLRYLMGDAGGQRVKSELERAHAGLSRVLITAVNWGEIVGKIYKSQGRFAADALLEVFQSYGLEIVAVDAERAARAAMLKLDLQLGYADAFCIELALDFPDSLLITADYDFKLAQHLANIEFLPLKPKL